MTWRPRRESNPYLALRRRSFYPLNYGGGAWIVWPMTLAISERYLLSMRMASSRPLRVSGNMRWLMSCWITLML